MAGSIYLLKLREFISTNENVYKIGRSRKIMNRLNQYPRGSEILFVSRCSNIVRAEREILRLFKNQFIQRRDIGAEYFEGDESVMRNVIQKIIHDIDVFPPARAILPENSEIVNKFERLDMIGDEKKMHLCGASSQTPDNDILLQKLLGLPTLAPQTEALPQFADLLGLPTVAPQTEALPQFTDLLGLPTLAPQTEALPQFADLVGYR